MMAVIGQAIAAAQQIQNLNEGAQAALGGEEGEALDVRDNPNAQRAAGGIEFNCDFNLKIGGLDIACKLGKGKDGSWEIGLVAQKEGKQMQGALRENPEQDEQQSFTNEAWQAVQSERGSITQQVFAEQAGPSEQRSNLNELEHRA